MKKFTGAWFAILLVLFTLFPMTSVHAEPTDEQGTTYEVSTWEDLKMILESTEYDGATLVITRISNIRLTGVNQDPVSISVIRIITSMNQKALPSPLEARRPLT